MAATDEYILPLIVPLYANYSPLYANFPENLTCHLQIKLFWTNMKLLAPRILKSLRPQVQGGGGGGSGVKK